MREWIGCSTISKEREGEIARKLLKREIEENGFRKSDLRNIHNLAKNIDVPEKELKEFFEEIVREIVSESFR